MQSPETGQTCFSFQMAFIVVIVFMCDLFGSVVLEGMPQGQSQPVDLVFCFQNEQHSSYGAFCVCCVMTENCKSAMMRIQAGCLFTVALCCCWLFKSYQAYSVLLPLVYTAALSPTNECISLR